MNQINDIVNTDISPETANGILESRVSATRSVKRSFYKRKVSKLGRVVVAGHPLSHSLRLQILDMRAREVSYADIQKQLKVSKG